MLLSKALRHATSAWLRPLAARALCSAGPSSSPAPPGAASISEAVALLLEQEDQGVAADSTEDLFLAQVMQQTALQAAVIKYFRAQMEREPNNESYTSLIYACVKLRHLDAAFGYFEEMLNSGHPPDARSYSHLIKGCGRARQLRRGEAFFRLLKEREVPQIRDPTVYSALINMHTHQKPLGFHLTPAEAAPAWAAWEEMRDLGVQPDEVSFNSMLTVCAKAILPDPTRALELLDEMKEIGVAPSAVTATVLMQVFGRANRLDEGRQLLRDLDVVDGVVPTPACYRTPRARNSARNFWRNSLTAVLSTQARSSTPPPCPATSRAPRRSTTSSWNGRAKSSSTHSSTACRTARTTSSSRAGTPTATPPPSAGWMSCGRSASATR